MHATDSNDRVHAVAATRVPLLQPHTNSGGGGGGGGGGGVVESGVGHAAACGNRATETWVQKADFWIQWN